MAEKWAAIDGFPNYEVSTFGRVRSIDRTARIRSGSERPIAGQIMRLNINKKRGGYAYIALCKDGRHASFKVHRLVAQAFIPNPQNKPEVNHIDNNPANNRVENLEWVTAKENNLWKAACGRSENGCKKAIRAKNLRTGETIEFASMAEAAKHGFIRASIWRQMSGEYSHHHGYVFEFIN